MVTNLLLSVEFTSGSQWSYRILFVFVRQCLFPLNLAAELQSRGVGGLGIATHVMTNPEARKLGCQRAFRGARNEIGL